MTTLTNKTRQIKIKNVTCGDCKGLDLAKLVSQEGTCGDVLGKKDSSKVCPKFRKNTHKMTGTKRKEHSSIEELGNIVRGISSDRIGLIGVMLLNERTTREAGYSFMQRVYVRYRGRATRNFLSNFMAAHVLQADSKQVVLCSSDGKTILTYPNTGIDGKDIYSVKAFKPMKAEMLEKGHEVDPEIKQSAPKRIIPHELEEVHAAVASARGEIASIEEVAKRNKKHKKKGKKRDDSDRERTLNLSQLADAMLSGEIAATDADDILSMYNGLGDIDNYGEDDQDNGYSANYEEDDNEEESHLSKTSRNGTVIYQC